MTFYEKNSQGILLKVKLNPKAKQNNIAGLLVDKDNNSILKINVTAAPENNKANKALIDLLAAKMGIAKSNFEIIAGKTSKNKKILVSGDCEFLEKQMKVLEQWI